MADQATMILRIRRRLHDTGTPPLYADEYYEDAIWRALIRVNADLCTDYTLANLPPKAELMVEIRATIEMLENRAGEAASSDVNDYGASEDASISVPNLTVTKATSSRKGPEMWLDLIKQLEDEYASLLDSCGDDGTSPGPDSQFVQQLVMFRRSNRTGRKAPYWADEGPPTPVLAVSGNPSGTVLLQWTTWYSEFFSEYSVYRGSVSDMSDQVLVATLSDNHFTEYEDNPGPGSWWYTIKVTDRSNLSAVSGSVNIVVV